jgi:hypothetical protein
MWLPTVVFFNVPCVQNVPYLPAVAIASLVQTPTLLLLLQAPLLLQVSLLLMVCLQLMAYCCWHPSLCPQNCFRRPCYCYCIFPFVADILAVAGNVFFA